MFRNHIQYQLRKLKRRISEEYEIFLYVLIC